MTRSDPLQPPALSPSLPVYGALEQIVRPVAPAITGNVYPAVVCQYAGELAFREREPCYIWEPNGVVLGPGYYDCRLVDSFPHEGTPLYGTIPTLPLYATTCCSAGEFPSSSSSSSSGSSL